MMSLVGRATSVKVCECRGVLCLQRGGEVRTISRHRTYETRKTSHMHTQIKPPPPRWSTHLHSGGVVVEPRHDVRRGHRHLTIVYCRHRSSSFAALAIALVHGGRVWHWAKPVNGSLADMTIRARKDKIVSVTLHRHTDAHTHSTYMHSHSMHTQIHLHLSFDPNFHSRFLQKIDRLCANVPPPPHPHS